MRLKSKRSKQPGMQCFAAFLGRVQFRMQAVDCDEHRNAALSLRTQNPKALKPKPIP